MKQTGKKKKGLYTARIIIHKTMGSGQMEPAKETSLVVRAVMWVVWWAGTSLYSG